VTNTVNIVSKLLVPSWYINVDHMIVVRVASRQMATFQDRVPMSSAAKTLPPVDEDTQQEEDEKPGVDEVDEEDALNDGAEDTITVMAHVRDKIIPVHCGFGTQQVVWLGHVAIARYDEDGETQGWLELGLPTKITKDGKRELGLTDVICDVLQDRSHVYVSTSLG